MFDGIVDTVYEDPSGRFEHMLVNSEDKNVFMVIVLDRREGFVHGHRLLDDSAIDRLHVSSCFLACIWNHCSGRRYDVWRSAETDAGRITCQ